MSILHILLFIVYYTLACYGIWKIPFFRKSGIRPRLLLVFFSLHVLAGCIHNIIAWRYYPAHGDIWNYFEQSFNARYQLFHDFDQFLADVLNWSYFTHNAIIFIHVVLDIFSFDNLYINTLLFSFPVFLGNIALFRVFSRKFPGDPLAACCTVLLPSTLFWTSCMHREGVLYMLLGFLLFYLDRLFSRGWKAKPVLYCLLLLALIIYFRIATAIALLPALLVWGRLERHSLRRRWRIITGSLIGAMAAFFLLWPGTLSHLLHGLSNWQQEFQVLEGHSRLYLPVLDGTWAKFIHTLPTAARNGLFEPLPGAGGRSIYIIFSLELVAIWCIILGAVILRLIRSRTRSSGQAFTLFCLVFLLVGLLEIGYIVPFAGTIVRYRSTYLPFLLAPFLHQLSPLLSSVNTILSKALFVRF